MLYTAFSNLIKNEIKNDEDDMKSDMNMVPQYIAQTFHYFCLKINYKITLKINDIKKIKNNKIKKIFITLNDCWCKLDVLISLFPNVKTIWIENLFIDETTLIQLYTFCETISSSNNNILNNKYKVVKLNEIIIVNAQFKIDTNDEKYVKQMKIPFNQIPWNITLDFKHKSKGIRLWKQ